MGTLNAGLIEMVPWREHTLYLNSCPPTDNSMARFPYGRYISAECMWEELPKDMKDACTLYEVSQFDMSLQDFLTKILGE
jgi:hypothetical protein